jgi:hypothetical protein
MADRTGPPREQIGHEIGAQMQGYVGEVLGIHKRLQQNSAPLANGDRPVALKRNSIVYNRVGA